MQPLTLPKLSKVERQKEENFFLEERPFFPPASSSSSSSNVSEMDWTNARRGETDDCSKGRKLRGHAPKRRRPGGNPQKRGEKKVASDAAHSITRFLLAFFLAFSWPFFLPQKASAINCFFLEREKRRKNFRGEKGLFSSSARIESAPYVARSRAPARARTRTGTGTGTGTRACQSGWSAALSFPIIPLLLPPRGDDGGDVEGVRKTSWEESSPSSPPSPSSPRARTRGRPRREAGRPRARACVTGGGR